METKCKRMIFLGFLVVGLFIGAVVKADYEVKAPLNKIVTQKEFISYYQPRRVDIERLSDQKDLVASYAYNRCLDYDLGRRNGIDYGCESMIRTFTAENMQWEIHATNRNNNGTYDKGFCQLNSRYHLPFISSDAFIHPMSHIDYCIEVWIDAYNRSKMPWYAYRVRNTRTSSAGSIIVRW